LTQVFDAMVLKGRRHEGASR